MRARRNDHASAGHRGGTSVRWRGAAVVVGAAALSLTAGAMPAWAAGGYSVTATIAVGSFPSGVAVDSAAGTAYVVNSGGGSVSVIDEATGAVTATVNVGIAPTGVAVDPAVGSVYVVNHATSTVSVIDEATDTLTATIPVGAGAAGVAADPTTGNVYVTDHAASSVTVINATTNTVTGTIPVGVEPADVAVDSTTGTVYVTNSTDGTVSVINEASGTVTATIPVGVEPAGVAVDPTTETAYVSNTTDGTVSVIDEADNTVTATIPVGTQPAGVAVDPSTGTVYVDNAFAATVSVIDEASGTVTATVPVGMDPSDVAVDPATHTAYVTNFSDGTVSVISAAPALPTPVVRVTSSQHPSTFGQKVTFTATVSPVDGGTITFSNGTTALCSAVALTQVSGSKYRATCTTTALPAGEKVTVTAVYPGDASYGTATGTLTQTVKRAPTTLTARIHVGKHGQYDVIALLTGAGQRVNGEPVSFSTGSTHLCTPVTNARGRANCVLTSAQTSLVQKDKDTVRATFAGDTNYKTSTTTVSAG
jgi:YVTN family beta-propeller protein